MDFLLIVLTLMFALTLLQAISTLSRISQKLPPGPKPLPILGNLHLLGTQPHKSLANLAKSYGPIMSLKLGRITTIVISSPAMATQVLQKQDMAFSDRYIPDAVHAEDHHKYSTAWMPVTSQWRILRKIMNTNMFSGNRLDANHQLRSRKVAELIEYCRVTSQARGAVDIGRLAFRVPLNLLYNTIFSEEFSGNCSDFYEEARDAMQHIVVEMSKPNIGDYFPVLRKFDPQGIKRRLTSHLARVIKLFRATIDERLEPKKSQGAARNDLLEALLAASQENPEEIQRGHIEHLCADLLIAGTDTTGSTLEWAMAELLKHPDTMEKAKTELQQVVGKGKPIKESDIASLPYLQCIIKETLRLHPPVPLLLPRTVRQDIEVVGCIVPKGSQVLVNAWAIGRDPGAWEEPLAFKPERFWGSKVEVRGRDFEIIPFGAGRRICPGLPLAMRMMTLTLGSLLNSFDWKLEEGIGPHQLDMDEISGLTLRKAIPLKAIPISL